MAFSFSPKIVTDGLVLALDAANPKSYPGTGSIWYDLSSKNNNCVFISTPQWSNGEFIFNGTSNRGVITNNASLNFSSEQTIFMVMNPSSSKSGVRTNPWNQAYGGYGTWTWGGNSTPPSMILYFGDSGIDDNPYATRGGPEANVETYSILATARNTSNSRWFKNGIASAPVAHSYGTLTSTSANITIGTGYTGFFAGKINYVLAYTRSLSNQELVQNYNAIKSRYNLT